MLKFWCLLLVLKLSFIRYYIIYMTVPLIHYFFYKQLGSDLSPQRCLYFQGFWGSKLLNGCFVVLPSKICLRVIQ